MNQLILDSEHLEAIKNLAELPVREREKIDLEIVSRSNTCAMDVMGLSWIFLGDDDF